jgi:hypothetical protein
MSYRKVIVIGVFCCCLGAAALAFQNASPLTGQWMIDGRVIDGKVELMLRGTRGERGHFSSSSMLPLDQLRGISYELMNSAGTNVRFEIARDAGTLVCDGYFKNGNGSGAFNFSPNSRFVSEMQSLGYDGLSTDRVFAMAIHDVTLAYVRDLRGLGFDRVSSDQLIAMRIHGVAIEYIREMKALGYDGLSPDNLVAMRIHGVSAEFAKELKTLGYNSSIDQMVAMRIHGVTPEFARELQALGYRSISADQMIAMRIHGAGTDFVKDVKSLGYTPTIDQLVAMRIHGVTPEYIRALRGRGMRNLTIDQLVSLKIHGIQD